MARMELTSLTLTNYRNIGSLEWEPPSGLVVLSGDNAQGKSNLLEAVYLLAIARSYRASAERELLAWDVVKQGGYALVSGTVRREDGPLEIRLGLEWEAGLSAGAGVRKLVRVNGIARRVSELVGLFRAVLFSPDDMEMVYGPPAIRRRYLDVMLCQASSSYLRALQRYQRVLTQRNHLLRGLRERSAQQAELTFWDESLCTEGAVILKARHDAMERLSDLIQGAYARLVAAGHASEQLLEVEYVGTAPPSGASSPEAFRQGMAEALQRSHGQERALAQTVVGPHRDDVQLSIAGMEMGRYASRGQARIAALALRLAEGELLTERRGEPPILLLDDVLSELDEGHRALVLEEALRYPQALVTTANIGLLPAWCQERAHHFRITDGQLTAEAHEE